MKRLVQIGAKRRPPGAKNTSGFSDRRGRGFAHVLAAVVAVSVPIRAASGQQVLDVRPDTLFYSAQTEIQIINASDRTVTIDTFRLATANFHQWGFSLEFGSETILITLDPEYAEVRTQAQVSPQDTAFLRVDRFDPCTVCSGKQYYSGRVDTLFIGTEQTTRPDTVVLDPSIYLPNERSMPSMLLLDYLTVYPNPTSGEFSLSLGLASSARIEATVYDLLGRAVVTVVDERWPAGDGAAPASLQAVPVGVYLLRLSIDSRTRGGLVRTVPILIAR